MICSFSVRLNRSATPLVWGLGDEGVGRLDAPELDLVGEVVRQILGAVIHPQSQSSSRAGRGRAIQPGKSHGDRLQGGDAIAALADMPADTLGVPMLDGGEDPAPAVVHREHPNAVGAPHEVRGMSDDLTVMGIAATAAAAMGREQVVLAHQAEHPLAGNPDVATDPKPSPNLAVALALPGRCLQVGLDGHQQRLVRDRGLRSPTLCRRPLGVLAGRHGVERGAGQTPGGADPPQAVGQARAGRGGGTHRRDFRRPKGPDVSVLASSSSTCMVNSPDPLHGAIQFRLHRIALAFLERGVDPADRLFAPLLEPEDLYAQLARQKFHRLATQKPQNDLTLARHRPSLAKSQRAGRQSLAWEKRGRAKLALVYHRPINSNLFLKIIGHVPVLLGHFD